MKLRANQRACLVSVGLAVFALLATAFWLQPDERGFGTHQGLGLPPCTFWRLTGVRCPSCGMTTAWAQLVRGRVWLSLQANAAGTLVGLAAVVLAPWALVSGLRGRWLGGPLSERATLALVCVLLGVTVLDWAIRLVLRL